MQSAPLAENQVAKQVAKLVAQVLETDCPVQGKMFLEQLLFLMNGEPSAPADNSSGPTGLILSSQNAANCLLSYHRTRAYWRGASDAVDKLSGQECINIVYPGPGPMASLFLPLWLAKGWQNVNLTLIEYNQATNQALGKLLQRVGLDQPKIKLLNCDASQFNPDFAIDILVMECMTKGLADEGQFAISTHLCQYLSPQGVLIPEVIRLDLHIGFLGKEFKAVKSGNKLEEFRNETRVWSQHLMSLDKNQEVEGGSVEKLVSLGQLQLPEEIPRNCNLFISTNITTFNGHSIPEFACGLTVPFPVVVENYNPASGLIEAHYDYSEAPGIKLKPL